MRQKWSTRKRIAIELAILLAVGYAAFVGWAQTRISRVLSEAVGDVLTVGQVRIGFPFSVVLSDVQLRHTPAEVLAVIKRVIIVPQWCSWRAKTIWLAKTEFEEPHLSFRRTKDGALYHPLGVITAAAGGATAAGATERASDSAPRALHPPAWSQGWQVVIKTIQMTGGTIGFVDEQPAEAFHGALAQLLIDGGPLTIPLKAAPASLTLQGRVVGEQARTAPVYCSGWIDVEGKNAEVSCRLDPFPLAAFGPYYHGALEQHVFDATLHGTGQVTAKANGLEGHLNVTISQLSEADVAVFGRTLADLKNVPEGQERALSGDIHITGSFDQPSAWKMELVPGNDIVQRLMRPLLERRIETLQIQVGTQTIPVGLTTASQDVMSNIQTTSQQVTDSLQVIAPTEPAVEPAAVPSTASPEAVSPSPPPAEPAPPSEAPLETPPSSTPSSAPSPSTSTR